MPTLMGFDPDHPLALGEVGREGVSVAHLDDMRRLFDGIDLGAVSTSMTISGPAPVALALFIAAAEESGVARADTARHAPDRHPQGVHRAEGVDRPGASRHAPGGRLDRVLHRRDAAVAPDLGLAGTTSARPGRPPRRSSRSRSPTGVAYVQELVDRGLDPDSFLPRFSFFFNCHIDLFEEVAKIRAARRMWATMMRDRFGAKDRKSLQLRTHCQTSGASLTAQQPLVNIARTAIEALAGVLAGTQSLHTNSYDETLALPTEQAASIALRTQQVLAYETGVASVADPLGGSWYVERLTDEIEAQARQYIEQIDALRRHGRRGRAGLPAGRDRRQRLRLSSARWSSGERVVVGVNAFTTDDDAPVELHRADPLTEPGQSNASASFAPRATRPTGKIHLTAFGLRAGQPTT